MFPKKTKCDTCGFRFVPEKEKVYVAEVPRGLFASLSEPPAYLSMEDCPRCGCQVILGTYYPRAGITPELEDDPELEEETPEQDDALKPEEELEPKEDDLDPVEKPTAEE